MNFQGVKVPKGWGEELELFNNGIVSCWYLKLKKNHETSLHMHEFKETALILLNGTAIQQAGLSASRPVAALDKTRFSAGYFHRHHGITDCDILEFETPINKIDVHRIKDTYGRAGKPYERELLPLDPRDPRLVAGECQIGAARLKIIEFTDRMAFTHWARKLPAWCIVVSLRGFISSPHGIKVIKPGHANWSHNLPDFLCDYQPDDDMQVMLVTRKDESAL